METSIVTYFTGQNTSIFIFLVWIQFLFQNTQQIKLVSSKYNFLTGARQKYLLGVSRKR